MADKDGVVFIESDKLSQFNSNFNSQLASSKNNIFSQFNPKQWLVRNINNEFQLASIGLNSSAVSKGHQTNFPDYVKINRNNQISFPEEHNNDGVFLCASIDFLYRFRNLEGNRKVTKKNEVLHDLDSIIEQFEEEFIKNIKKRLDQQSDDVDLELLQKQIDFFKNGGSQEVSRFSKKSGPEGDSKKFFVRISSVAEIKHFLEDKVKSSPNTTDKTMPQSVKGLDLHSPVSPINQQTRTTHGEHDRPMPLEAPFTPDTAPKGKWRQVPRSVMPAKTLPPVTPGQWQEISGSMSSRTTLTTTPSSSPVFATYATEIEQISDFELAQQFNNEISNQYLASLSKKTENNTIKKEAFYRPKKYSGIGVQAKIISSDDNSAKLVIAENPPLGSIAQLSGLKKDDEINLDLSQTSGNEEEKLVQAITNIRNLDFEVISNITRNTKEVDLLSEMKLFSRQIQKFKRPQFFDYDKDSNVDGKINQIIGEDKFRLLEELQNYNKLPKSSVEHSK